MKSAAPIQANDPAREVSSQNDARRQPARRGPAAAPDGDSVSARTAARPMQIQRLAGNQAAAQTFGVKEAGDGQPLDPEIREEMEARFSENFSQVRVHTGPRAAESARELRAKAYTLGSDIVFSAGRFNPGGREGQRLLSHELTHVVQQGQGGNSPDLATAPGEAPGPEQEARNAGQQASGGPVSVQSSAPVGVQREPEDDEKKPGLFSRALDRLKNTRVAQKAEEYAGKGKQFAQEVKATGQEALGEAKQELAEARDRVVAFTKTEYQQAADAVSNLKNKASQSASSLKKEAAQSIDTLKKRGANLKEEAKKKLIAAKDAAVKQIKRQASDKVLEYVGEQKGIVLEAANLVDSLLFLDYEGRKLEREAVSATLDYSVKKGLIRKDTGTVALAAFDIYAETGLYEQAAKEGYIQLDATGPSVAGIVGPAIDKQVNKLENVLDPTPASEALVFTAYETGELKGAIEAQAALLLIDVEEVQLVLKLLGAVGGARGILQTIEANPKGWKTDPAFYAQVILLGLSVVGLSKSAAANRIVSIGLRSAASISMAIPAVEGFYQVYTDPELKKDPANYRKKLFGASKAVLTTAASIVMSIIHSGLAGKVGKGPGPGGGEAEKVGPQQGQVLPEPQENAKLPPPAPAVNAEAEPQSTGQKKTPALAGPEENAKLPPPAPAVNAEAEPQKITGPQKTPALAGPEENAKLPPTAPAAPLESENATPITAAKKGTAPSTGKELKPGVERPVTDLAGRRVQKQAQQQRAAQKFLEEQVKNPQTAANDNGALPDESARQRVPAARAEEENVAQPRVLAATGTEDAAPAVQGTSQQPATEASVKGGGEGGGLPPKVSEVAPSQTKSSSSKLSSAKGGTGGGPTGKKGFGKPLTTEGETNEPSGAGPKANQKAAEADKGNVYIYPEEGEQSGAAKGAGKTEKQGPASKGQEGERNPENYRKPFAQPHKDNAGSPIDPKLLELAREVRVSKVGISLDDFKNRNVAVAKIVIQDGQGGSKTVYVAAGNIVSEGHSEQYIVKQLETIKQQNPGKTVILDQLYSERIPCETCVSQLAGRNPEIFYTVSASSKSNLVTSKAMFLMKLYGVIP